ncbi:cytochrome P450 [Nocardia sp. CDC159]|uniref:Cytochrome P450 n=1 Tax=Nocardia pulmonis TaxID=2951408 RepID=A0A9X2EDV9_9NOCA|nr:MULTISPECIES: cytochrome P450 [Nocardia]MCM6779042.1 cytochrome P450 [Nocardia pulmonis]MCM6791932.1 cytochrome P450 [Nocardia sp. CDC159]
MLRMFVWYEVLADLISGAVLSLSSRPAQRRALMSGADRLAAVDDLLRYLSPQVLASPRFATTDVCWAGSGSRPGRRCCSAWPRPTMTTRCSPPPRNWICGVGRIRIWRSATGRAPASAPRWSGR